MMKKLLLEKLTAFQQQDKFTLSEWLKRGLNPSGNDTSQKFTSIVNKCIQKMIEAIERDATKTELKSIIKKELESIKKVEYDTEEREFVGDVFYDLAQVVNIDLGKILNIWMYGRMMGTSLNLKSTLTFTKSLEKISQKCEKCGIGLETLILRREEGVPDFEWTIVQCTNCDEYSIISFGPNVKEVKFINYVSIEGLPKDEFTREQAEQRLEQIRYFRKSR